MRAMTGREIVSRLTHHHIESKKCVADYHRFQCPHCSKRPLIEHVQFIGRKPLVCYCGLQYTVNFQEALRQAGPCKEVEGDPWRDTPLPK